MIPGSNQIHSLATKYSKPQLQQMAQMGEISPLDAVMAGMMIDRIVLSANKPPESTVADDVFTPKTQLAGVAPGNAVPGNGAQEAPGGAQQEIAARMHMPKLAQAPQSAADISKAYGGLMSIPRPGEKYNQDNFATGGIVAFQEGGSAYSKALRESEPWKFLHSLKPSNDPMGDRQRRIAEISAAPAIFRDDMMAELRGTEGAASSEPFQGSRLNLSPKERLAAAAEADLAAGKTPSTVKAETQKQLAKVQPAAAPTGPLAAMAQQAAPASDEFAQQGADLMKLPTRTPTNTTGLIDTPEEIAKDREDILNSTIGYAGAEIMAGKSQFAMTNIGEGLSKAFASYAQRIGEHKKLRKSDIKDFATITQADEALKSGDVKAALNAWTHLNDTKERAKVEREKMLSEEKQERIRAGANTSPFEAWLKGTPEQRAEIEKFASIVKDKREFSEEQKLNREKLWYETVQYQPEYKGLSAAKLEAARQQWVGGGGKGEVNKSNPLLTGK